jgi:HSP20 family molecular chaperone IbpA
MKMTTKSYDEMTPEERTAEDARLREEEEREQAKLPYSWKQTLQDVDVTVSVPRNLRSRDLHVKFSRTHLTVGIKGQDPIVDGELSKAVKVDDSTWLLDAGQICIHFEKVNNMEVIRTYNEPR